jgi:hypothetical protein
MSYLPFRDNPALADISEARQQLIALLADELEQAARQAMHDHEVCGCDRGREGWWKCPYGGDISRTTVDTEEIIGLLFAQGRFQVGGLSATASWNLMKDKAEWAR